MAESSLSLTYSNLADEVARHAGWKAFASWTATNTADFSKVLKSAFRKFYWPPSHDWSFLRVYTTLSVSASDADIDLPDNFSGRIIDDSVTFNSNVGNKRLVQIDEAVLRDQQAMNPSTGIPQYFAIRAKVHAPTTGQRHEILLHPTPHVAFTLRYAYVTLPDVIDATNIYPVGGALYSEVILEAVLSEVERLLDDDPTPNGPHMQAFTSLLAAAIEKDKASFPAPNFAIPAPIHEITYGSFRYFMREVGDVLEYGRDQNLWSEEQFSRAKAILDRGLFQFYFPPPLPVSENKTAKAPHEWSFLFPVASLTLVADTETYDLPNDFAGILRDFVYTDTDATWRIPIVNPESLRQAKDKGNLSDLDTDVLDTTTVRTSVSGTDDPTGLPTVACIEPKAHTGGTRQIYQVTFYPPPHKALTLSYRYQIQPVPISDDVPWPLGTTAHTETILASCLLCAQERYGKGSPNARTIFLEKLSASVGQDEQVGGLSGGMFPILHTNKGDLQVDYFYLQRQIGNYLDLGWNPDSWTHEQQHAVDEVIESGYRRYLYPDTVEQTGHQWSFLQPIGSIQTSADQRYYPLPVGFERFIGALTFDDETVNYSPIEITSENRLRQLQTQAEQTAYPSLAATRVQASDGKVSQRQELILHPTPDGTYTLSFQYAASAKKLSRDNSVPLGGPAHAEGILASCFAVAEEAKGVKNGPRFETYKRRLLTMLRIDAYRSPQNFGYNGDPSTTVGGRFIGREPIGRYVTYLGDLYED